MHGHGHRLLGDVIDERRHYLRHPRFLAVTTADAVLVVEDDGRTRVLRTDVVAAWSTLLQDLLAPYPAPRWQDGSGGSRTATSGSWRRCSTPDRCWATRPRTASSSSATRP
jgi:hypothetical protein